MKKCGLCNKTILSNDNYVRLTDYKEGKFFREGFYHLICYKDRIIGKSVDRVKINDMMNRVSNLLGRAEEITA